MTEAPPPLPEAGPPPLPTSPPPGARAPLDEKILLVLSYVGLLALVPYLVSRPGEALRFHARQGLALALLGVVCAGLSLVPFLGFVGQLGLAATFALSIVGIVKALQEQRWRMFVAADVADRLEL